MVDHAQFLLKQPRYAKCFKQTDGANWARELQAAGYATDPDYEKEADRHHARPEPCLL
jgi:flagellum-specific peptidoglycan hydrolase FlgJ